VAKQAFVSATPADNSDILFSQYIYGIMGLGLAGSEVNNVATKSDPAATWGHSFLANIFSANPKTSSYVAFLLDRETDLDQASHGVLDIGMTQQALNDATTHEYFRSNPE